jgi:putative component of membrane protein insertase Oxa1/YidC/SpoIIIJ protein YidD
MKKNNFLTKISIYFIKYIWQKKLGKNYNQRKKIICRFYPSCSEYSVKALQKYGFFKGWMLTFKRLKRCNEKNTESCIDYP